MKNCFKLMTASILFAVLVSGCEKDGADEPSDAKVAVTGVTLDRNTLELTVGETWTLTASVAPETATDKETLWHSADERIAVVDGEGTITAISDGETSIAVSTKDGGFEDLCAVTVRKAIVPVISLSTGWKRYSYEVGDKVTIDVALEPDDATRDLEWTSNNTAIVQVDAYGVIEAITPGSTVVTVKDRNSDVMTEIGITVLPVPSTDYCLEGTPNWGGTLGDVTFRTDRLWEIGDQIWSDVVLTSVCSAREDFQGSPNNNAGTVCSDCRKGHDGYGNFFTQCAVVKFRKELCPDGWRVPTVEDLVALDIALGGSGKNLNGWTQEGYDLRDKYISEWNAEYGGNCTWDNKMAPLNRDAYYWTQTQHNVYEANGYPNYGMYLRVGSYGQIQPQYSTPKYFGMALRCVR